MAGSSGLSRAERMRGAVLGQFTGDALCLGTHWYYNLADRAELFPGGIHGFEAPLPGHYHFGKEPGDLTHYGDAALVLLRSVALAGRLDPIDYGRRYMEGFAPETYQGYRDKPTQISWQRWNDFMQANPGQPFSYQDGANDDQNVTTSRLAPVVVRHGRDGTLDRAVEQATRVCQNNDEAVAHALIHAHILERLLEGEALEGTLETVIKDGADGAVDAAIADRYDAARSMLGQSVADATGEFGRSCTLSKAFPSCLHTALKHGGSYETALLECCRAGGDNASRSGVLGAWLGAVHGVQGIPPGWLERVRAREEIERLVGKVIEAASA
jgi:ADP-ribosylglycohydrolase